MLSQADWTQHRPPFAPASPKTAGLAREWETYRQELSTMLAQGLEGQFVLLKGDQIIGYFDSWEAASTAGLRLFLLQPFLVRPISRRELSIQKTHKEHSRRPIRSRDTVLGHRLAG
jgi:hypothetical protein